MRKRILLADDDADDRALFREAVSEIDSTLFCHAVNNGDQALRWLEQEIDRPDVIFLDVNMPVVTGWECIAQLKQKRELQHIPVIMYSTTSQKTHVNKALSLGALCLLTKPDSFQRIKEILTKVISTRNTDLLDSIKIFPEVKWKVIQ